MESATGVLAGVGNKIRYAGSGVPVHWSLLFDFNQELGLRCGRAGVEWTGT